MMPGASPILLRQSRLLCVSGVAGIVTRSAHVCASSRDVFHPGHRKFSLLETFEQIEWLMMDAAVTMLFPIYIVWIFLVYGMTAWDILGFITTIYLLLDAAG